MSNWYAVNDLVPPDSDGNVSPTPDHGPRTLLSARRSSAASTAATTTPKELSAPIWWMSIAVDGTDQGSRRPGAG